MKIGFISRFPPTSKTEWSGTMYSIYTMLQKEHEVEWVSPHNINLLQGIHYYRCKILKLMDRKTYDWYKSIAFSQSIGKNIKRRLKKRFDFLFAPAASTEISFLETDIPIIYLSDATFGVMINYYDSFSNLSDRSIEEGNTIERNSLTKAKHVIFSSSWALQSAKTIYGISEDKLSLLKFGPNLPKIPEKHELVWKKDNKLRLLFVGTDWKRKGGDIAVDTLNELKRMKNDVHLNIVGCSPSHLKAKEITVIPFLNKYNVDDFQKLCDIYLQSDFLILPTRAECSAIVYSESSSFGLPIITTDTGGIPDYVQNGVNGYRLPLHAGGYEYAQCISSIYHDEKKYRALRDKTRVLYEKELNWFFWLRGFNQIIKQIL